MPDYNPDSLDAVVSRIETKIDTFVQEAREWREAQGKQIGEIKASVDAHERFKYWFLGAAAAAGVAGGKLLSLITGTSHKP